MFPSERGSAFGHLLHGGEGALELGPQAFHISVDRCLIGLVGLVLNQRVVDLGRLMGFGHRVYKNYDPRARIIKKHVDEVLEATGTENPLLKIAVELEKRALDDSYFTDRKLYPNVDFYSGIIYEALQIPRSMFTVMFAIPRTSGWIAQWLEMLDDPETKIARPRQIYTGQRDRDLLEGRKAVGR